MLKCVKAIAIKSRLFRVTLTWQFLRCSWVQRRQSSGWLPPNWSRPPPQSDRSPGSWRRQSREKFWIYSNSSTVASVHHLYASAHMSQTPFISPHSWQQDLSAVAKNQKDKWDNEASTPWNKTTTLTSGRHVVYKAKAFSVLISIPAIPVCCSSICDCLDKDAQLLQAHVSPCTHPDDTDAQAIAIWKRAGNIRSAVIILLL